MILAFFSFLILMATIVRVFMELINVSHISSHGSTVPDLIKDMMSGEDLRKSNEYSRSHAYIDIVRHIVMNVTIVVFILSGLFAWYSKLWQSSGFVLGGILFFAGIFIFSYLLGIPFSYYDKFVIEQRYGFNTSTIKTWIGDLIKGLLVSGVISGLLLLGVLGLIRSVPEYWWIMAWLLFFLFSVFFVFIYPYIIAPIFNRFSPVEGPLAENLIAIAREAGIKVSGVFQMDASRRSKHTNAYFTGLGRSKRIVLYDTLIHTHPEEEILPILAHEIGHWKKKHVIKLLIISQILSFLAFAISAWTIRQEWLYDAFGLEGSQIYVGLFIMAIFMEVLAFFISPMTNSLSRYYEKEADQYSVDLIGGGEGFIASLKRLLRDNLAPLFPHPLYVFFFYSHPPVIRRIESLTNLSSIK